jgi:hypothetical protein
MNTFATLLLAFPFYLAIKGKLAGYVGLAKTSASSSVATSQAPLSGATVSSTTPATATQSTADVMQNVSHIFETVATLASV